MPAQSASTTRLASRHLVLRLLGVALAAILPACAGVDVEHTYPDRTVSDNRIGRPQPGVFGEGGLKLLGGTSRAVEDQGGGGIGVNSFLWRASLDSIAFMPLASADPFGGVIITDWFTPPETPGERFKLNVYILGRELRADGLKAAVFRQRRDALGGWVDATVESRTTIDLENAILTRARQLRIATARQ